MPTSSPINNDSLANLLLEDRATGISYFLRKPKFPLIVDAGTSLIAAANAEDFARQLVQIKFPTSLSAFPVIDATGEGFAYYPEAHNISAMSLKKRWTKKEIITMYLDRKPADAPIYSLRSLSSKSLPRVVHDIVELIRSASTAVSKQESHPDKPVAR